MAERTLSAVDNEVRLPSSPRASGTNTTGHQRYDRPTCAFWTLFIPVAFHTPSCLVKPQPLVNAHSPLPTLLPIYISFSVAALSWQLGSLLLSRAQCQPLSYRPSWLGCAGKHPIVVNLTLIHQSSVPRRAPFHFFLPQALPGHFFFPVSHHKPLSPSCHCGIFDVT